MKIKAPRRKARSSVTSARNTDTRVSVAQAGRSEDKEKHTPARRTRPRTKDKFEERKAILDNYLHLSLIFLSFQSSASPATNWDTKLPCALRRRRTRSAFKPQDPQARQYKARQQPSTTTLPAYSVGTTTTPTTTVPVSSPKPFYSRDEPAIYIHPFILCLECRVHRSNP